MPRDIVSEQQINIQFVKEVQKHPTLYNFELPSYSRKDVSDKAWEEVGKATNMTPSACRERWRNLRAVFMRTIKALPRGTGKKKPYYLADVMQFVVPFMRPIAVAEAATEKQTRIRETEANKSKEGETDKPVLVEVEQIKIEQMDDTEYDEWGTETIEEETEIKPIKPVRKRSAQDEEQYQSKKVAQLCQPSSSMAAPDSEHVKSFLNSLLPELTEMDFVQFKHFKRRVLLLIDDITTEIPASSRHTDDSEYIM